MNLIHLLGLIGETTEDLNNIGAGIYTVTATDPNGLTISLEIEITEPAELTATETISSYECGFGVSCYGATDGSIDITVGCGQNLTHLLGLMEKLLKIFLILV